MEWSAKISTSCLRTLDDSKFDRITLLPLTEDLLKIRSKIKEDIKNLVTKLNDSKSLEDWRNLAEVLGTRLTIFNRRRGNEVYQMLVSKFEGRNERKKAEIEEIRSSLSPLEKRLVQRYRISYFSRIIFFICFFTAK